jgi:signal transduction histidine kinase/CheY-like chemotaxis protein
MSLGKLRKGVIIGGALLCALIIAADLYQAWRDRVQELQRGENIQRALCIALAEQTARMIQDVDVALSDFAQLVATAPGLKMQSVISGDLHGSQLMHLSFVKSITVIGADGHMRMSTRDEDNENTDWSRRGVFSDPKSDRTGLLYVGKPRASGSDVTIAVSRAIRDAHGNFQGVVIARISYDYLNRFYAAVSIAPDAIIRLFRDDGQVLASFPASVQRLPPAIVSAPSTTGIGATDASSEFSNDRNWMFTRQRVGGYPMLVAIAQPTYSALQPWRQRQFGGAVRTGVLVVLELVLIVALVAELRRREAAEQERLRLEQQLLKSQQTQTLGMFAASIAHDFNNVLGAISGYSEIARDAVPEESVAGINIRRLIAAGERARQLVNRVLTFNPSRHVQYAACDVAPILYEVIDQVKVALPASVTVQVQSSVSPAYIQGDATELHQVIMNLCSNAVRAMPQGGVVALELARIEVTESRAMNIGELHPGQWLRLMVKDGGIGMNADAIKSIFEPFYTTKKTESGGGIGLAVVANIVVSMHGAIEVISEPGKGTRFLVYWPSLDVSDAGHNEAAPEVSTGQGEIIMVVDDDVSLVYVAEELLAALGYEPVGFTDPQVALQALRQEPNRFDALLSDESMPGMRGSDLALAARQVKSTLPIVLMTGVHDASLDVRARDAQVFSVLHKPLVRRDIGRVFSLVFGRHP